MLDKGHWMMGSADGAWHSDQWLSFGAMGLHGVFMLLLVALLIVALIALVRGLGRGRRAQATAAGAPDGGAASILEARYARGEVDRDEYLQKRRDLMRS